MSTGKWTPGPWKVDPRYWADIQTNDGKLEIATVCSAILDGGECLESDERKANAHLIAAAPDLYDEHKQWAFEIGRFIVESLQGDTLSFKRFLHAVGIEYIDGKPMLKSKAIAKAEGKE